MVQGQETRLGLAAAYALKAAVRSKHFLPYCGSARLQRGVIHFQHPISIRTVFAGLSSGSVAGLAPCVRLAIVAEVVITQRLVASAITTFSQGFARDCHAWHVNTPGLEFPRIHSIFYGIVTNPSQLDFAFTDG